MTGTTEKNPIIGKLAFKKSSWMYGFFQPLVFIYSKWRIFWYTLLNQLLLKNLYYVLGEGEISTTCTTAVSNTKPESCLICNFWNYLKIGTSSDIQQLAILSGVMAALGVICYSQGSWCWAVLMEWPAQESVLSWVQTWIKKRKKEMLLWEGWEFIILCSALDWNEL